MNELNWICDCGEKEIVSEINIPAGRILLCVCSDPKCENSSYIQLYGDCKGEHIVEVFPEVGHVNLSKYLGRKEEE
jgi:hypothetical protein